MNDENDQRKPNDQSTAQPVRMDLDWTESEWFQVWLDLARRPYRKQMKQLERAKGSA